MDVLESIDVIMNTMPPICVLDHGRFGGAPVIVWAVINGAVLTALVIVKGALYLYEILQHHNLPLIDVNIFYLRLYGVRHMVKSHTLLPHALLFPICSKGFVYSLFHRHDNAYNCMYYTRHRSLDGTRNSPMEESDSPSHAPPMELHRAPCFTPYYTGALSTSVLHYN